MGRFLTPVLFVMVVAFGLVPAAALAQQPRVVRENGRDVLLVPVRGRMDLGAVVRLGNQHAAPGTTITADVVVEANPGKMIYACYKGRGDHYGSRNPASWQTCPTSQQRRWVVTGLEYRVPLQPRAAEQNVVSSAPTRGVPTQPASVAGSVSAPAAPVMTDAQRAAFELRLAQNEGMIGDMPDAYRASLHDHREFAERMDKIETEQRYLWMALIVACLLAIGLLFKSLWPSRQETQGAIKEGSIGSLVPSFAGASVPGPTRVSSDTKRKIEAPVLRTPPSIIPTPTEFSAGARSVPPPIPKATPAEPPQVTQYAEAQIHGLALNLAAEQRTNQVFLVGKDRLPRFFRLAEKLHWKLHDTVHRIRTLEALPVEAPARRDDPEHFAAQLAKLRHREKIVAPRFARVQQAFDSLHYAHTGLRLPRLWEAPDEQLLQQRADVKLLRRELDKAQAKLDASEPALLSANGKAAAAQDEAESQRKLRDEEATQFAERLKELRAESHRERDAYVDDLDAKVKLIEELREQLAESERSGKDQDRQIHDLSDCVTQQTGRIADLLAELTSVVTERDRFKVQNEHYLSMLDLAAANGNAAQQASTRKITQSFEPMKGAEDAAEAPPSGSRPPKTRSDKT